MSQTQIHCLCSSQGGNFIPNLILHGEIKEVCYKEGKEKPKYKKLHKCIMHTSLVSRILIFISSHGLSYHVAYISNVEFQSNGSFN